MKFEAYDYVYEASEIGNYNRLRYLQEKPKTIDVAYYPSYKSIDSVLIPEFYVIPQAWHEIVRLLQYNQVKMRSIESDTTIPVQISYISRHEYIERDYEGHHPIRSVETQDTVIEQKFLAGDYLISTHQKARRFLISVLEPRAVDSYLRWNFFDAIFQQKEYFSAYVFEDTAVKLLEDNPDLKKEFELWKERNPEQAKSAYKSLDFIYKRSPYYEKSHLKYPVGRIF